MTQAPDTTTIDRALLETAASWRLRIFGEREPDPAEAEAFERWLSADPRHQDAFDRVAAIVVGLDDHAVALLQARRVVGVTGHMGRRLGRVGDPHRLGRRHLAAFAVADGADAVTPGPRAVQAREQLFGSLA